MMDQASSRSFLYSFGRDRFLAACAAVSIADPELRYAGDTSGANKEEPENDKYWARISRSVVDERQETLRNGALQRRFVTNGLVFVQLFGPVIDSKAQDNMDKVAELVRNDFRTYQGEDCEFTGATINDTIPAEPAWLRANITSNYQFRQFIS
jgi:hypothetical protein